MEAEQGPAHLSISPTFSSYSSGSTSSSIAEIAARVVREIGEESLPDVENRGWEAQGSDYRFRENSSNGDDDDDDEFEFAVLCREPDASTSSANEIFYNGQIKPVYPVFNTKLLLGNGFSRVESEIPTTKPAARRSPLSKLMYEEKPKTTSLSSLEADDELGDVPSDTYCVWSPNTEKSSPGRSNKRNSIGSSNGWKLMDLLYINNRSKGEGEDAQTMRRTSIKKDDQPGNVSKVREDRRSATSSISGLASLPLYNARYERNRAVKEAEKRKSYLPYRPHLVGCVVNANSTI